MKKLFLLPVLFFFAACTLPENPDQQNDPKKTKEILSAYEKVCDYQQAWTTAQLNAMIWVEVPGANEHKMELGRFVKDEYPKMSLELKGISKVIVQKDAAAVSALNTHMDELALIYKEIMNNLSSVVEYNDPAVVLPVSSMILDSDGECVTHFKAVNDELSQLKEKLKNMLDEQIR